MEVQATAQKLAEAQRDLGLVRDDIHKANAELKQLQGVESSILDRIAQLQHEHAAKMQFGVKAKAEKLKQEMVQRDAQMKELQAAMERAMLDRDYLETELQKVLTIGDTDAAGTRNTAYHDPLSQVPVTSPTRAGSAPVAVAIDDIGQHDTASPYVKKGDYQIAGPRPITAEGSSKFRNWRKTSSRVTQPPGGRSSNIFG